MELTSIGSPLMWGGFIVFVLIVLAVDLLLLGRKGAHRISHTEALSWSAVWLALAFMFAGFLWWYLQTQGHSSDYAKEVSLTFLTGYLIEKSLSIDNVFVFLMIFSSFAVPPMYQRRVLLYGVLGAIVMRAVMIFAGAALITRFHWLMYVFGAFLILTAIKMLWTTEGESDIQKNPILKWVRKNLRITNEYHGEQFSVRKNGLLWFTPLFVVLVMIELSDLVFAVDSIPAIFAVTRDPFIVMTSNIFAILGLRAMYFLLADVADRFHLLKYGLAAVLTFIGSKMLLLEVFHIPIMWSLGGVFGLLAASVIASLLWPKAEGVLPKG